MRGVLVDEVKRHHALTLYILSLRSIVKSKFLAVFNVYHWVAHLLELWSLIWLSREKLLLRGILRLKQNRLVWAQVRVPLLETFTIPWFPVYNFLGLDGCLSHVEFRSLGCWRIYRFAFLFRCDFFDRLKRRWHWLISDPWLSIIFLLKGGPSSIFRHQLEGIILVLGSSHDFTHLDCSCFHIAGRGCILSNHTSPDNCRCREIILSHNLVEILGPVLFAGKHDTSRRIAFNTFIKEATCLVKLSAAALLCWNLFVIVVTRASHHCLFVGGHIDGSVQVGRVIWGGPRGKNCFILNSSWVFEGSDALYWISQRAVLISKRCLSLTVCRLSSLDSTALAGHFSIGVQTQVAFKLGRKSEASISEMSVSHLLLHEHFLNTDSWMVNSIDLATDWSPLVVSSTGSITCSSIMHIVLLPGSTSPIRTGSFLQGHRVSVPYEMS